MKYKIKAEWTDDCSGKKDYDGDIISLSTRYWPAGGGFSVFDREHPELGLQGNETRPGIRPSAKAEIVVQYADKDGDVDYYTLATEEFEADTEAEVKLAVEKWAQSQFENIVSCLKNYYGSKRNCSQ